jgi:hypothetical protein
VLDASNNPYAQHFAASSLVRLLTENTLSSQVRARLGRAGSYRP